MHKTRETRGSQGALPTVAAAAIATGAFVVPYAISRSTTPSPDHPAVFLWYRTLSQPWFKPPDIAIPLAWFGIESGLAYATFRLLRRPSSAGRRRALALMAANVVGIGAWSRLFFGGRSLPASTIAATALVVAGVAAVEATDEVDRPAAIAIAPFVAWVAFATVLTAAIWRRNR